MGEMKPTGWFRRIVDSLDLPGISPFVVFTSGASFLTTKSANNDFAKCTVPTLRAFLKASSQDVRMCLATNKTFLQTQQYWH